MRRSVEALVSAFGPQGLASVPARAKAEAAARSPFAISSEEIRRVGVALAAADDLSEQLRRVLADRQWNSVRDWADRGGQPMSAMHSVAVQLLRPTASNSLLVASFATNARDVFTRLHKALSPPLVSTMMRGQIPEIAGMALNLAPIAEHATSHFALLQEGMRKAADFCAEPLPRFTPPDPELWKRVTAAHARVAASVNDGGRAVGRIDGMWHAIALDLRRVGKNMSEATANGGGPIDDELLEMLGYALEFIVVQWEQVATDANAFASTTNELFRKIS